METLAGVVRTGAVVLLLMTMFATLHDEFSRNLNAALMNRETSIIALRQLKCSQPGAALSSEDRETLSFFAGIQAGAGEAAAFATLRLRLCAHYKTTEEADPRKQAAKATLYQAFECNKAMCVDGIFRVGICILAAIATLCSWPALPLQGKRQRVG